MPNIIPIRRGTARALVRELEEAERTGELRELFYDLAESYRLLVRLNGSIGIESNKAEMDAGDPSHGN